MGDTVLIHCNAGREFGMGHLMRALGVAEEAIAQGMNVVIAGNIDDRGKAVANTLVPAAVLQSMVGAGRSEGLASLIDELDPHVVHVDSYWPDADGVAAPGRLLSNMQDGKFGRRRADLTIDANLGAEEWFEPAAGDQPALVGASATVIRNQVREQRVPRPAPNTPLRVLVVIGGTDPHVVTTRVTHALSAEYTRLAITVVTPPDQRRELEDVAHRADGRITLVDFVPDLPALARQHDLVVTAAGTSVWDFACMGAPMALICVTENQLRGYHAAIDAGIAVGLGESDTTEPGELVSRLGPLLDDPLMRSALSDRGRKLIDGRGAWRIVASWRQLISTPPAPASAQTLRARPARMDDARMLLDWRNDEATRRASRSNAFVPWASHVAWLENVLSDERRELLVVEDAETAIGTVRWDHEAGIDWEVSITVAPEARGRGLSRSILDAGERLMPAQPPTRFLASIHEANVASRTLFARAGYLPHLPENERGFATFAKFRAR